MSPLVTWAIVATVVCGLAGPALVRDIFSRTTHGRERRARPAGETSPRRRTGAALHVIDHEVEGWFGPAVRVAAREARRPERYELPIESTTRRAA